MAELHLDWETFSECDLLACGSHKYAAHPSTDILCAAWAFDDDEPTLWLPHMPCHDDVFEHIVSGGSVLAWNALFERLIFRHVAGPKFGWPVPNINQFECIMVRALAMGLPGKLEKAGPAVGLDIRKDDAGHRIMKQLSKPRKPTKRDPTTRFTPDRFPEKFAALYDYCLQDVRVEQGIAKRVVKLNPVERQRYWLDQEINDRGVHVDMPLILAAEQVVNQAKERLDREIREVSGYALDPENGIASTSAVTQIKAYLIRSGLQVDSLDKDHVIRLLARDDLTNEQRTIIALRQEAAKASTAKLDSFQDHANDNDDVLGSIQFNGAATGRDAARGVQLQNFPRPMKGTDVDAACADILKYRDAEYMEIMYGRPAKSANDPPATAMSVVSDCLRSMIIARPGNVLYSQDLSQIEARMTVALAGQWDKVRAFEAYDRKEGPDIYTVAAAGIYGAPAGSIGKDDEERQVGKVGTLACGFGGGAGAFGSMAKIYRVDMEKVFPTVWEMSDEDYCERAAAAYEQRGKRSGMSRKAWIASELIKMAWRDDNEQVVQFWYGLEEAAIDAMKNPGATFRCRDVQYRKTGSWLRCILPSGRSLFYPFPRLEMKDTPWGEKKYGIIFKAQDQFTKQWKEFSFYGGFACQNVVQAAARDVMWEAVERAEEAGYWNVLRVHDEMVAEVPIGFGSQEEYHRLIVERPKWLPRLPVASDGWVGPRYRKG